MTGYLPHTGAAATSSGCCTANPIVKLCNASAALKNTKDIRQYGSTETGARITVLAANQVYKMGVFTRKEKEILKRLSLATWLNFPAM